MSDKKKENMKPDKMCHYGPSEKTAKKTEMPGQMYVPKKIHNESNFVGEKGASK